MGRLVLEVFMRLGSILRFLIRLEFICQALEFAAGEHFVERFMIVDGQLDFAGGQ